MSEPSPLAEVTLDPQGSARTIPPPKLERSKSADALALFALVAFVLVGGLLVFGFARALVPAAEAQLGAACRSLAPKPLGVAMPELELEDLAGNPVSLDDFRGKYLIVNFWATWCAPCEREWPDLAILGERLEERDDVVVIAISVDEKLADIQPYLERMGLAEPPVLILHDKTAKGHEAWGSEKIPDTYFVNREGIIEMVFVNLRAWGRAAAFRCVDASVG